MAVSLTNHPRIPPITSLDVFFLFFLTVPQHKKNWLNTQECKQEETTRCRASTKPGRYRKILTGDISLGKYRRYVYHEDFRKLKVHYRMR